MKNKTLILILFLAFILRLGVNLYLGIDALPDRQACGADAVEFEELAWNVASGHGYTLNGNSTAFRAPGFPFMIAAIYKIFGRNYLAFHIFNIFVSTSCCYILYLLTFRVTLFPKTALWATFVLAVMPLQVYYSGHYLSENLAIFFSLLTTYMVVLAVSNKNVSIKLIFLSGLFNGISILIRPVALLYIAFLGLVAIFWGKLKFIKIVYLGIIFCLGTFIVMAPWTYRNYKAFNRLSLVASNGGSTFWGSNNEIVAEPGDSWGTWISTGFAGELKKREVLSLSNEIDRDKKEWALGKKYIKENKEKIPMLILGKYYRLISPFPVTKNRLFMLLVAIGYFGIVPLAVFGVILSLKDRDHIFKFYPIIAQFIVLFICTGIFYGSARFRSVYEPFFIIYAAIALSHIQDILVVKLKGESNGAKKKS